MQAQSNKRMPHQTFYKRKVGPLIRSFHYVIEISDRLVSVDEKYQVEFRQVGTSCRCRARVRALIGVR